MKLKYKDGKLYIGRNLSVLVAPQLANPIVKAVNNHDALVKALDASNEQLKLFHDYGLRMRRTVMKKPNTALRYGFTYIDLDTLDDLMCQGMQNDKILDAVKS